VLFRSRWAVALSTLMRLPFELNLPLKALLLIQLKHD
jgi:hypothetical protein